MKDEAPNSHTERLRTVSLALVVALGVVCAISLLRWIDSRKPLVDPNGFDESLYLNGKTARRMSLAFNGLAADWYWMRSLQYIGRKIINFPENLQLDNLQQLNLKLLAPLLDAATTLDPEFMEPYEYAAVVLPAVDVREAIRITNKGIDANPHAWRLYQHLGYIYWQEHDFKAAGETYARGAALPGAPIWMEAMKARMAVEGGSRDTAREIYTRMYEQAEDRKIKEMARRRLLQVDHLDLSDALRKIFAGYRSRTGRCPASWREIEPVLRAMRIPLDQSGAPLDPAGMPYLLAKDLCDVELNPQSEIPLK